MLTYTRARAEDVRALAGAIVVGSAAGLLLGAAYLVINPAKVPDPAASAPASPTAASGPVARLGAGRTLPIASAAPRTLGAQASPRSLRDRFRLAGELTRAVANPFQFASVAQTRSDQNCLAEAVYFEARGEGRDGQQAVAQVVLNRVRHPAFPKSICAVVHQRGAGGCQFSFACSDHQAALNSGAWRRAETVASAALHGVVMAAVGDATHFQTARSGPFAGLLKVAQVGAHVFYRFSGHAGAPAMFHRTPAPSVEIASASGRVRVEFTAFPAPATATDPSASKPAQAPAEVQVAAVSAPAVRIVSASASSKAGIAAMTIPAAVSEPRKGAEAVKPAALGATTLAPAALAKS